MTPDEAHAAATTIAYRFLAREQPRDDLTLLAEQFLRLEEQNLGQREAVEAWMTGRGMKVPAVETAAELIGVMDVGVVDVGAVVEAKPA